MKPRASIRSTIALGIAAACAFTLVATCAVVASLEQRGAHPRHSPDTADATQSDGFPHIDWDTWQTVNPDVIGWITIPGTGIDHPIVQAHRSNPQFYLTHDVYGAQNFTGCPYLDASCENKGLMRCPNSVVFGHNMGWNQDMFADLEYYGDRDFAAEHRVALLQTPEFKVRLSVQAADVIPGWESIKRTEFSSAGDFADWWHERYASALVRLAEDAPANGNLLTLCTCSYSQWQNERTLVYCMAA